MDFLIIHSGKEYDTALRLAKEASRQLDMKLELRGMYESPTEGLTTDELCGCGENHGYIPRGRFDSGEYISIEYSDYYEGFTKGLYMVIVSTGGYIDEQKELLSSARKFYKDAYIKTSSVYLGCMH
ncbi:hypothetical protein [Aquimarina addita]